MGLKSSRLFSQIILIFVVSIRNTASYKECDTLESNVHLNVSQLAENRAVVQFTNTEFHPFNLDLFTQLHDRILIKSQDKL